MKTELPTLLLIVLVNISGFSQSGNYISLSITGALIGYESINPNPATSFIQKKEN